MTEKQKLEAVNFIPAHMISGIAGSAVCFAVAVTLKVRSVK